MAGEIEFKKIKPIFAHVGRIADSVEGANGHDPSSILVSAQDTVDGVEISVDGGAAAPPGVVWSVPLRDILGRLFDQAAVTYGRPPALAAAISIEKTAWNNLATPSNQAYFVGIANDRASLAQRGAMYLIENTVAGQQRAGSCNLTGGAWAAQSLAVSHHADIKGIYSCPGGPPAGSGNGQAYAALSAYPLIAPSTSINYRVIATTTYSWLDTDNPHMIFGVLGQAAGVASIIKFKPMIIALNTEVANLENL